MTRFYCGYAIIVLPDSRVSYIFSFIYMIQHSFCLWLCVAVWLCGSVGLCVCVCQAIPFTKKIEGEVQERVGCA